jgi:hypothetical protein
MQEITQHVRQIVPDFSGALTPLWRHGHSRELLIGCLLFMRYGRYGCDFLVLATNLPSTST